MAVLSESRAQLAGFLRARREAVSPTDAGLSFGVGQRRRTPGLRREEVAQLCGISTTWYTWIEQGRDIALSAEALSRLADALKLTAAERAYVFELARRRDPAPSPLAPGLAAPPQDLCSILQTTTAPAYLLDRLWRPRTWNAKAGVLFAPWFDSEAESLLHFVFLDPKARKFIWDWEDRARRVLGEFRADLGRTPLEPELRAMAASLMTASPDFARIWTDHAVLGREGGERQFDHPELGPVRYRQTTLVPSAHTDYRIVILLPVESAL